MPNYSEQTFTKVGTRGAVRPGSFKDLLFHPIADDPDVGNCYDNWEFHHAQKNRFYIAGSAWFFTVTNANRKQLEIVAAMALAEVKNTGWPSLPNSGVHWESFGRPQFQHMHRDAMLPQKAAMSLLACEIFFRMALEKGQKLQDVSVGGVEITDPAYVYRRMSIVPAVWNIDNFNRSFWAGLTEAERLEVAADSGQPLSVIADLANGSHTEKAKGCTVTYQTALDVRTALVKIGKSPGQIRAKPGRSLGQKRAAQGEMLELG